MEFGSERPIWLQIADRVADGILTGRYPEGERIPSVRELAVELEVNPNTVVRSYSWLEEKVLVENRRGLGYFVALNAREAAGKVRRERFERELAPSLFREADLLGFTPEEVRGMFLDWKEKGVRGG